MIVYPNAKINLGLNVVARRPDGFHDIETVFYPIALSDMLEIALPHGQSERLCLQQTGLPLDVDVQNNICRRAVTLLSHECQLPPVAMHLHKIVPTGAGLGGGSSDAAFVLTTLNQMLGLGLSRNELRLMAAQLGADVAFFVENQPMLATGIGDQLQPIALSLAGKKIVLVKPQVSAATREAYQRIVPCKPTLSVGQIVQQPISTWRSELTNDFEKSIFALYPEVGQIKEELYAAGAVYAQMSGSGTAVFGIFDNETDYSRPDCFVWRGELK